MTQKPQTGGTQKSKSKKSKYLLRRIAIVMTCCFIVILMIGKIFNRNTDENDMNASSNESIESNETTKMTEMTEITEMNEMNETTDSTEIATDTTESTEPVTETTATEAKVTETNTEITTREGASVDFSEVSYYLQARDARYQAYLETHKGLAASEIVRDVNMNLDYAFYDYIEKVSNPNALSVICNKYYQLPSDFTPDTLVKVPEGYFVADGKTYQLKQNALDAFITMSDAAKKEGLSLRIISAYRSNDYQANLYQKYKNNNGQKAADRFSARPGHSEHETGLAIDINEVAQAFENTEEFTWLSENAHKYGYVLRYPIGMENVTGYMYEPWHYRYLGADVATQLKNSGLTYDAYYALYLIK